MARSTAKAVAASKVIETTDVEGNTVRVPIQHPDLKTAQPDSDGVVPEFVNISGKRQIVTVPWQPADSIRVPPMGVLKGAQWRSLSEPAPAWGHTPAFMEREKRNGKYDEQYLLTEDQLMGIIPRLKNSDPDFGARDKLKWFLNQGKPRQYDRLGQEMLGDNKEDRPKIRAMVSEQIIHLDEEWEKRQKAMGIS